MYMNLINRKSIPCVSITLLVLMVALLTGCQSMAKPAEVQNDTLYQVSLLNALMLGEYDGILPVSLLTQEGDIGIGTFDTLDGEMILLDGITYKAKADGKVVVVQGSETVPFASVTFFDAEISEKIENLVGLEALKTQLEQILFEHSQDLNSFYVAKIEGFFPLVHVRSVPAQEKPYKRLSEIAETQKEYVYENLEGTIVAFRCPTYVEGINLPLWHLHFLSADKSKGGHLLDANLAEGTIQLDSMREFHLLLPQSESFAQMDIAHDLSKETKKVEGKQ
jgi:acetolactate decarboxylase